MVFSVQADWDNCLHTGASCSYSNLQLRVNYCGSSGSCLLPFRSVTVPFSLPVAFTESWPVLQKLQENTDHPHCQCISAYHNSSHLLLQNNRKGFEMGS